MSYSEAVELLKEEGSAIEWGDDVGGADETILASRFDRPVIVHDYPKSAKAFYMKENPEDPRTVLCNDMIAPEGYGEIIGGSQREDDLDKLRARIREEELPEEALRVVSGRPPLRHLSPCGLRARAGADRGVDLGTPARAGADPLPAADEPAGSVTPKLVLHMRDGRPAWTMPAWVGEEIRAALPPGWNFVAPDLPADGSGDGAAAAAPELLEVVRDATVYLGLGVPGEVVREGRMLRWVHSGTAGIAGSLTPEMRSSSAVFTNSAGIHGPPVADTVLAMVLHFARGLDFAAGGQRAGEWRPGPFHAAGSPVRELASSVVGILGFGGIGREVGARMSALGAKVLGLRRRASPASGEDPAGFPRGRDPAPIPRAADPARLPRGEDPAQLPRRKGSAHILRGEEGLRRLLAESDYVVVTLPETPETTGMLDRRALEGMKGGAVLINVARGSIVDEGALADLLQSGRLRGAGLDVFRSEPLPGEHPFWSLPNVLVTPHVSACTPHFWRRQTRLIVGNIRRFLRGEPLQNVVDPRAGY